MIEFLADNFSSCVAVAVLLVAMIPTLETKLAIPLALSVAVWGDKTLSPLTAVLITLLGGAIVCVIVIFLFRAIKKKTSGFIYERFYHNMQVKYEKQVGKINEKGKNIYKLFALAAFVAVPLPLTGVYSGSIIAGLSSLKPWQSFLAVMVGDLASCLIMLMLCCLFENSAFYVLIASICVIAAYLLVSLIVFIFRRAIKKRKEKID